MAGASSKEVGQKEFHKIMVHSFTQSNWREIDSQSISFRSFNFPTSVGRKVLIIPRLDRRSLFGLEISISCFQVLAQDDRQLEKQG